MHVLDFKAKVVPDESLIPMPYSGKLVRYCWMNTHLHRYRGATMFRSPNQLFQESKSLPVLSLGLVILASSTWGQEPAGQEPDVPNYSDHTNLMLVQNAEGALVPVRSPADWAVRRAHILGNMQKVMGPLPGSGRRVPLDVELLEEIDEGAYVRRKITYASEPRDRVPAWLLVPKGEQPRKAWPAALCLHQTVQIGKDEPVGLGGRATLRYAKELAERGYVVLAPDYPNFGEHEVNPYDLGYASATMKAIWDNMRGVDLLLAMACVDPDRVAVIGHSLGGHNAIFTAVFDDRIAAIVTSSGFNSFRHYYEGDLTGWSHKGYMPRIASEFDRDPARMPFDFPELVGALAPRAFFTNSPLHDDNFAVEGVRACIESATPIYDLLGASGRLVAFYPDAPHEFPDGARRRAYSFLDEMLEWDPPRE